MRYLVCIVDADPCPTDSIASLPFLETVDFTAMGITPEVLFYVFGWGFAAVFLFWLLGLGTAIALAMIRKL
ncbi:hypothetical protein EJP67_24765 [Variovorax guangxiensis]|uniref:Uncharacterized protein n=1 Tax=Variovorax guangxiensis TaxID=1775474 RepID=A0A3S0XIR5_9BURK|nr:hypothetical protein [Variovorax guangxiensis]RUR70272.1 hypothetical protein EJP67_24765 [Variovorax guangxiensis]